MRKRGRLEDYIRALYVLERSKGIARVKDLAEFLGVKPPTVVEYLHKLEEIGLVEKSGNGYRLTSRGEAEAEKLYARYLALYRFLREVLMLPHEIAEQDACYMEHGLHPETLERIVKLVSFIDEHRRGGGSPNFLKKLNEYFREGRLPSDCTILGKDKGRQYSN